MSIPAPLQTIIDEFRTAPTALRLPLLLEYANRLPPPPPEMATNLERVAECQTPLFLKVEVQDDKVVLYFDAPPEAPTTRGFASVVKSGLEGASVAEVLDVNADFYQEMGLAELISPLRLRGMGAIVVRVKRQLAELA